MRDSVTHRIVLATRNIQSTLLQAAEWSEILKEKTPADRLQMILEGISIAENQIAHLRQEVIRSSELESQLP